MRATGRDPLWLLAALLLPVLALLPMYWWRTSVGRTPPAYPYRQLETATVGIAFPMAPHWTETRLSPLLGETGAVYAPPGGADSITVTIAAADSQATAVATWCGQQPGTVLSSLAKLTPGDTPWVWCRGALPGPQLYTTVTWIAPAKAAIIIRCQEIQDRVSDECRYVTFTLAAWTKE